MTHCDPNSAAKKYPRQIDGDISLIGVLDGLRRGGCSDVEHRDVIAPCALLAG